MALLSLRGASSNNNSVGEYGQTGERSNVVNTYVVSGDGHGFVKLSEVGNAASAKPRNVSLGMSICMCMCACASAKSRNMSLGMCVCVCLRLCE
jgi:hypothetical protein